MKKLMAVIAATFMMGAAVFAEAYISANDLEPQVITSEVKCEDGFTLIATPEKGMEVSKQSSDCPNSVGDETFTKRIKIGGSGKVEYRSISFPAKAGQTVTVYSKSSSKTESRLVALLDAEGKTVATSEAGAYPSEISVGTFKIEADGTYYITSKKSTIYVYEIIVK